MIRPATTKDIPEIKKLIDWAAENHKVLSRDEDELHQVIHNFFVWIEEDAIIGCCSLEIYNKKLAEVRSLVIRDLHQGKGIGRALVDACIHRAKEKGVYEVLTITDKDAFFEKLGFNKCLDDQWALFMKP